MCWSMLAKVTQLGKDDLAYGSYSFNKVGMSQNAREDMCAPVHNNRIFFAGEACHNSYFGTTHGEWPLLQIFVLNQKFIIRIYDVGIRLGIGSSSHFLLFKLYLINRSVHYRVTSS